MLVTLRSSLAHRAVMGGGGGKHQRTQTRVRMDPHALVLPFGRDPQSIETEVASSDFNGISSIPVLLLHTSMILPRKVPLGAGNPILNRTTLSSNTYMRVSQYKVRARRDSYVAKLHIKHRAKLPAAPDKPTEHLPFIPAIQHILRNRGESCCIISVSIRGLLNQHA